MSSPIILVVDDAPQIRKTILMSFESMGYSGIAASNGIEALNFLEAYPSIRVLLLDINMPHMNGFDAAQLIAQRRYPNLKICIISGSSHEDDVLRARQLGITDFLVKPLIFETLQSKLAQLLGEKPKHHFVSEVYTAHLVGSTIHPDIRITHLSSDLLTLRCSAACDTGITLKMDCPDLQKLLEFPNTIEATVLACVRTADFGQYRIEITPQNLSATAKEKLANLLETFS